MSQELQNCVTEAQGALNEAQAKQSALVTAALDAGKFVVVCDYPWHCRSTDAVVGTLRGLIAEFGTREEAEVAASSRASRCDDERYGVLPVASAQTPTAANVASLSDECPF